VRNRAGGHRFSGCKTVFSGRDHKWKQPEVK
jgi:hypothetical protein